MVAEGQRKTALIAGGTDGIGKEIARGLALAGHQVILLGRDSEKGARTKQELEELTGKREVRFFAGDVSLMAEVRRMAREIRKEWPSLNYLVHSAGVVRGKRTITSEGIESNFAINYLSGFLLTRELLPLLKMAGRVGEMSRIVVINGAAQGGRIYFEDINLTANFGTLRMIGQSCRANDLFTVELSRRLAILAGAPQVTINCVKIGVVKTSIRRDFPWWMRVLVPLLADPLLGQTPREAAEPVLRLLLDREYKGVTGSLFLKIKRFRKLGPSRAILNPETRKRLWDLSERLTAQP